MGSATQCRVLQHSLLLIPFPRSWHLAPITVNAPKEIIEQNRQAGREQENEGIRDELIYPAAHLLLGCRAIPLIRIGRSPLAVKLLFTSLTWC